MPLLIHRTCDHPIPSNHVIKFNHTNDTLKNNHNVNPSHQQNLSIRQPNHNQPPTQIMHRTNEHPLTNNQVIQLNTREEVAIAKTTNNKNFPIIQQNNNNNLTRN